MARNRIKTKSEISIIVQYTDNAQLDAVGILDMLYKVFPKAKTGRTYPAKDGQKYNQAVIVLK